MIDKEKIKRLLAVAEQQDQIKLKILHDAVVQCTKDYHALPTSANLTNWQKAESALDAYCAELSGQHFAEAKTIKNALAVVDYLAGQGWKVKKSAVYKHHKEGKIRAQQDGTFRVSDVERYAETFLRRRDGSETGKLEKLQQERLQAELRKTVAQAEHWENRARAASGIFIAKDQHERDLARRAALFRTDLDTFVRSEAPEIVAQTGGDAARIPELVTWMLGRIDLFLARYTEERSFEVPLLPTAGTPEEDLDEDDEGGDE